VSETEQVYSISGSKTREVLQKCVTTGADAKLREVAVSKLDDRAVALLSREAVSAEAHFHRSCYRAYTKEDYVKKCSSTDSPAENEYCKIEDNAFPYVCHYIRCNLFVNPRAIMFNDLRTMLLDHMKELGCTQVSDSTRKNLRRKLEEEFQDSVNIISDEKGRLVIYPDSISQDKLVLDILNLQQELSILKSNESDNRTILTKAALILRADILAHNHTEIWPPQLDELNNADAFLSTSVIHFYRTVIAGTCGDENLTVSANRQIKSFGQDLIHAVTRGKRHPPKHFLLPLVVKSLMGNVELVNILNRFSHCVSYSVTEEIETALCIQKLQSTSEQGIAIPSKIHPN